MTILYPITVRATNPKKDAATIVAPKNIASMDRKLYFKPITGEIKENCSYFETPIEINPIPVRHIMTVDNAANVFKDVYESCLHILIIYNL